MSILGLFFFFAKVMLLYGDAAASAKCLEHSYCWHSQGYFDTADLKFGPVLGCLIVTEATKIFI